jgi:hypothetical protein
MFRPLELLFRRGVVNFVLMIIKIVCLRLKVCGLVRYDAVWCCK